MRKHVPLVWRPLPFHRESPQGCRQVRLLLGLMIGLGLCGCDSRPAAVEPVAVDAGAATSAAMERYDHNQDGALAGDELDAVPGIKKHRAVYDLNGDGNVSRAEMEARFKTWQEQALGLRELLVRVTLDGKPLAGARVEFLPEPYLTPSVKPASGQTDQYGIANVSLATEDMPERFRQRMIRGVTVGTYKVRITHGRRQLPKKDGKDILLGEEVAFDTVDAQAEIALTSD